MSDPDPVPLRLCFDCNLKINGASTNCVVCFLKRKCCSRECASPVDGDSRYCKTCALIEYLRHEIKNLRDIIKIFEKEEDARNEVTKVNAKTNMMDLTEV